MVSNVFTVFVPVDEIGTEKMEKEDVSRNVNKIMEIFRSCNGFVMNEEYPIIQFGFVEKNDADRFFETVKAYFHYAYFCDRECLVEKDDEDGTEAK